MKTKFPNNFMLYKLHNYEVLNVKREREVSSVPDHKHHSPRENMSMTVPLSKQP